MKKCGNKLKYVNFKYPSELKAMCTQTQNVETEYFLSLNTDFF